MDIRTEHALNGGSHHDHTAHFYDNEKQLNDAVSSFLHEGFSAGQPLVVIATPKHRQSLARVLKSRGLEVRKAVQSGRLAWRDARQTLDRVMVNQVPDANLFSQHVGGLIAFALARTPMTGTLRAYGEMVDELWRAGNQEGALRLEEMWNELATRYSFSLFCGYDMANFSRESDAPALKAVCDRHSRVLPSHAGAEQDLETRSRALVMLQQRARALETEIDQRKSLEQALRRALASRRRTEHERERLLVETTAARAQAEYANRIKDEFLAVVSHELRTPLNAIRGWAQIIAYGRADASTVRRGIDVIQRNAQVQHELIEELLDVSRILAGKVPLRSEVVDLLEVVRASIDVIGPSADAKTVSVEIDADSEGCPVNGDPVRLRQVVWNLLSNAVKFSGTGGRVVVSIKPVNGQATLLVQDEGVGIPPEFLPSVFDRFRQADPAANRTYGGLGLGLTVVRHLVEAHGGTVTAHSMGVGRGATFALALPLVSSFSDAVTPLPEAMEAI